MRRVPGGLWFAVLGLGLLWPQPLVAIGRGPGYAIRSSYPDAVDVLAPWRAFDFAADRRGVQEGLALLQLFPHNVKVADDSGNICYQRTGRVPRRPAGYDWSKPVDGTTSDRSARRAGWRRCSKPTGGTVHPIGAIETTPPESRR